MFVTVRQRWGSAILATVVAASAGCAAAPRQRPVEGGPVATGTGTLSSARKFLEGRWALESFEVRPPGKSPVLLKGDGTLLYDDSGNLKMDIRADEASSDLLRAAGVDIRDGVIATEGRTAIDLQNRTLTYVVQGQPANARGPLGTARPRHWEVTADSLVLTTQDDAGQPLSIGRWRRMP